MFQGEACRRRINSTEDAAKCRRTGTNWLRRFYMVEGISYRPVSANSRFSGRKTSIVVSDPCPKRSAISSAIRVGIVRQTWQETGPVSRRNGARIRARNRART